MRIVTLCVAVLPCAQQVLAESNLHTYFKIRAKETDDVRH